MAGELSASVTSHDVARLAGVSQPTVSRALRDSPKVSEETKARVREAARALGYVPSETGRALSSGRTRRIGCCYRSGNQFYPHVIAPMHHELEALGYQLCCRRRPPTRAVAERLIANGLDGVLSPTTVDSVVPVRLRDRGVPFVYFNRASAAIEADRPPWTRTGVRGGRRGIAGSVIGGSAPSSAPATPAPGSNARPPARRVGRHGGDR